MNKSSLLVSFILYSFLIVISASPLKASASTDVFDDITANTTWDISGSPYLVDLPVFIDLSVTLTIDPGVVVKFGSAGSLTVNGTLKALGTSADKIYFTSILDDSIAGDTNGDGETTLPKSSDWQGVSFFNSLASNISNTEIRFAGYGIQNFNSNLSIIDSVFKNIDSGLLSFGGENNLKNLSIFNIGDNGISLFDSAKVIVDSLSISGIDDFGEAITLFENSSLNVDNSSFSGITNNSGILVFEGSDLSIDHSIISGFSSAIADYGSGNFGGDSISIKNSQIKNNNVGVSLYADDTNFKATGNAIQNNALYGAQTFATFSANFKNNFWGDPSGPYNEDSNTGGLGDKVFYIPDYNKILFSPWLVTWPSDPAPCCSSVIFVPGFEGSRLYEKKGNKDNQFWDPTLASFLQSINKLFLDKNGTSINNIYTKDVLDKDINGNSYYSKISDTLNDLKNNKNLISNWSAYAYDWRLSVNDLIESGTKYSQSIKKLEDEITTLALDSKTQKVTLVGHSNGGLMIKKVISELKKHNKQNLIDKIIFVDSPQLGTPSALTATLHGYGTKLGFGLVLREGRAREWLVNMPGVYGLVPSNKLIEKMNTPIFEFDQSIGEITNWLTQYGNDIDYTKMKNLILGGDGRQQPNKLTLNVPYVLNNTLLDKAEQLHNEIDDLVIPSSIEVYEIAGWGLPTISGIYYDKTPQLFSFSNNINLLRSKALFTYKGDGEVLTDSQVDYGFNKYYLDIAKYNDDNNKDFTHSDIMENPEILDTLENIITDSNKSTPHIKDNIPVLPDYATPKYKIISMHSPADIDVYDSSNRHVGIAPNSNNSDDMVTIETGIPNSNFLLVGNEKYAIVPDNGENYDVKITGTGSGLFTLGIEKQQGDNVVDTLLYQDLPVTKNLKADIEILGDGSESYLDIDHNGDGVIDESVLPNTEASPLNYLEIIKTTILDLDLPAKKEKNLLNLVNNIYKLLQKGKIDKATKKMQNFLQRVELSKGPVKNLTQQERDNLVEKITQFLESL